MDYKIATQNWTIKLQLKIELKANCKSKIKIVATIKLEVEVVIPIKIELKVGANAKQNLKHDIKIRNYFVYTYTKFDFCPQWLSIMQNCTLYDFRCCMTFCAYRQLANTGSLMGQCVLKHQLIQMTFHYHMHLVNIFPIIVYLLKK